MNAEEPGELQAPLKAHHGEEQRVATLFKLAERHCVIYQTLRAAPAITVSQRTKGG